MKMTFPVLTTDRLVLRKMAAVDSRDMLTYLSDERVMKHYGMSPFESEQDALDEIGWYDKIFETEAGIRWALQTKEGQVIGSCGFHNRDHRHHRAELGFELSAVHWGQGLMREALAAVIAYGFEAMSLNRIQALVEPANAQCVRLLEKAGFRREGLLAQYEFTLGKYDDLFMYALVKSEYANRRPL
ncbi:GNAT family N-acetyltransferase [Paenibacillus arenilitoris]|uniref:GNAT family N-acetyltransferase n=1 Tax=Paenibacillus arenilitoris TaxID=2772299 RepID=A0A927H958_9BACL|nr:GNAT family protein [Paenibacillus arenilitoris]MBD2871279.1 GNAT family N-acetyltransferase [Paenibacillus arenilitoris]